MQVPAAISEAVEFAAVQKAGVVEVRLTGRPELAVAANIRVELAGWAGIGPKLMVC